MEVSYAISEFNKALLVYLIAVIHGERNPEYIRILNMNNAMPEPQSSTLDDVGIELAAKRCLAKFFSQRQEVKSDFETRIVGLKKYIKEEVGKAKAIAAELDHPPEIGFAPYKENYGSFLSNNAETLIRASIDRYQEHKVALLACIEPINAKIKGQLDNLNNQGFRMRVRKVGLVTAAGSTFVLLVLIAFWAGNIIALGSAALQIIITIILEGIAAFGIYGVARRIITADQFIEKKRNEVVKDYIRKVNHSFREFKREVSSIVVGEAALNTKAIKQYADSTIAHPKQAVQEMHKTLKECHARLVSVVSDYVASWKTFCDYTSSRYSDLKMINDLLRTEGGNLKIKSVQPSIDTIVQKRASLEEFLRQLSDFRNAGQD